MARLLKATTAVLVVATMAAVSVDAQLPAPMPNYPVPAYPVPGAIRDPGHRVVPPPESVDLARCLQSVPPPGTSPSEQAARCRRSFGGPGGRGEEPPPTGSSDRSSQPPSPAVPDASSTEARARRMRALEAFPEARKALVETLRPILAGLDEAADAERARGLIDAFESRYGFLRGESSVRPTADTLRKLQDALRDFERASRIEQESEQQVASLVRQQRLSAETRDPSAHPRVIAANLKASAEQRDAAARERAALSAAIRRLGDQLVAP
jgi:hypothetical protein